MSQPKDNVRSIDPALGDCAVTEVRLDKGSQLHISEPLNHSHQGLH